MKYYVITYGSGEMCHGYFNSYIEALSYAENHNYWHDCFTIEDFVSEADYFNNYA